MKVHNRQPADTYKLLSDLQGLDYCYRMLYMLYDSWASAGTFLAGVLAGHLHNPPTQLLLAPT